MARLATRLTLTSTEVTTVWLLVAIALDHDARRFATAIASNQATDPTLDALCTIVYGAAPMCAFRELGPNGTLRRFHLIERSDGGGPEVHESRQTWAISRRILALLHGDTSIDPELAGIVRIPDDAKRLDELAVAPATIEAAREAVKSGATVVATGAPGLGRRTLVVAAAREAGIDLLEIDGKKLAKDPAALRKQLRLVSRECKLLARAPLVRDADAVELLAELDGRVFATTSRQLRWDWPAIVVPLAGPTSAQRAELWRAALGGGTASDADFLAAQYPLAPALIHHAARAARTRATDRPLRPDDIYAGIRAVLDDRLGGFTRRVDVTQTWDDLVLPDDQSDAIAYLIARIRQRRTVYEQWGFAAKVGRGLGVSALF